VLEEVAKSWKNCNGGVIVDGASAELKDILKTLEGNMSGGKIMTGPRGLSRQNSLLLDSAQETDHSNVRLGLRPTTLARDDSQASLGMSGLAVEEEADEDTVNDPRKWLKVVDAFAQPRMLYNVAKKHFEKYANHQNFGFYSGGLTDITPGTHQNPLSCLQPRTRQHCSETASKSYTSGCSATNHSRHPQYRPQGRLPCDVLAHRRGQKSRTKSLLYRIC